MSFKKVSGYKKYPKKQVIEHLKNPLDEDISTMNKHVRDEFPKLAQHCGFVASTGVGKSFLIKYLLIDVYQKLFDEIFVYVPSGEKERYDIFDIDDSHIIIKFEPEDIDRLIEMQKQKFLDHKGAYHTLIILDDTTDLLRSFPNFADTISRCRHESCSIWLSEQQVKFMEPSVRNQLHSWFINPNINSTDTKSIGESTMGVQLLKKLKKIVVNLNKQRNDRYGWIYWTKNHLGRYFYCFSPTEEELKSGQFEDQIYLDEIVLEE